MDGVFFNGDGNPMAKAVFLMGEATAEGRLDNCSPRLACLPGVGCRRNNLPPKSGCINYLQGGGWYIQPLFGGSCVCIDVTG